MFENDPEKEDAFADALNGNQGPFCTDREKEGACERLRENMEKAGIFTEDEIDDAIDEWHENSWSPSDYNEYYGTDDDEELDDAMDSDHYGDD